jgi:hypothetical protein
MAFQNDFLRHVVKPPNKYVNFFMYFKFIFWLPSFEFCDIPPSTVTTAPNTYENDGHV